MAQFSGELWPNHPHRLPDELLSFWMVRVAHANRVKLQTFTNATFGRTESPWARDIDRSAGPEFIEKLSLRTGATVADIRGGMLSSYEGIVFERHNEKGNTPWILPLGIYHRTRRAYGMQFCPQCLFWDKEPYFRRRWRLAFATICDKHGNLLHDRCPLCEAPVIFFRNDLGHRTGFSLANHTRCWQCGFDLRRAPIWGADLLDGQSYIALRSLLTFIDSGISVCGPHFSGYSGLLLEVLHRLCEILVSNSSRRRFDRLRTVVSVETGMTLPVVSGRAEFERLGLLDRHRVLLCALWLLMEWPDRFVQVCRKAGLSRSFVLGDIHTAPYWFDRLLDDELNESRYVLTTEEARNGAEYLVRSGTRLTRTALQRVLGRQDKGTTAPYRAAPTSSWPTTDDEFDLLLSRHNVKMKSLPDSSTRRQIAERDRIILLTMKTTGWNAQKVLGLTLQEIRPLLTPSNGALSSSLKKDLRCYLQSTRSALGGNRQSDALFVGSKTPRVSIENLAAKVRALK